MTFTHTIKEQDVRDLDFLVMQRLGKANFKRLFFVELISLFIIMLGIYIIKFECFCFDTASWFFGITVPCAILIAFLLTSYKRHCVKKQLINHSKAVYEDSLDYVKTTHEIKEDFLYSTTKYSNLITKYENIKNIIQSEDKFFIMLGDFRGFVFDIDEKSKEFIKALCQKTNKDLQLMSINGYKNRFWG